MTTLAAQEAEYAHRLAIYAETGDPCDRSAAEAVNPHRNDPAWNDIPDHLLVPREKWTD